MCLLDEAESLGEEVALVRFPELLACDREWGTRHSASQYVDISVGSAIDLADITLIDVPRRPIHPERLACVGVNLYS
ncbi:hypothetical protein AWC30_07180 [Mycolicibacillus trivialis]|uniref:Uncharacterized protein n=1 Tax=Mycolicibacillus trivialis TaxID=1798 RepID=A0A1X2EMC3_9MYCO|nr:hypothetical protein AWC30_07180 [Mycolicibacillus trivialis]